MGCNGGREGEGTGRKTAAECGIKKKTQIGEESKKNIYIAERTETEPGRSRGAETV